MIHDKKITISGMRSFIRLFRGLLSLQEPSKENVKEPNASILLDIRDEAFRHLNMHDSYIKIFRVLFNFPIIKLGFDSFYMDVLNWVIGEAKRRGWQLPGQNRPSSILWNTVPPLTRNRLNQSIIDNYTILQDRLKTIDEKLNGEERKIHRASRYDQFAKRILTDFEREVIAWR